MTNGLFVAAPSRGSDAAELAQTLYKTPTLVHHGVRCGKEGCCCQRGHRHGPYAFLYWRDQQGRQRRRYVRQPDVAAVAAVVRQRRTADRAARRAALEATVRNLLALRPNELAAYRDDLNGANLDDPHLTYDRAALAHAEAILVARRPPNGS